MTRSGRAIAIVATACGGVAALLLLLSWVEGRGRPRSGEQAPSSASARTTPGRAEGPAASGLPSGREGAAETSSASPSAEGPSQGAEHAPAPLAERLMAAAVEPDKHAYREVLRDWRTGALSREEERSIDDVIAPVRDPELDKAAGALLFQSQVPAQRQALAALLATSGSDTAVGFLVQGARADDAGLRADALRALATVAEPGAVPVFARAADRPDASPEMLGAILDALRNIDAHKARDLEARIRSR